MAWIGSMNRTLQTSTATSTEDQLVMNSIGVDPHGETSFTTCHPLGSGWRQEWTFDEDKTWAFVAYLEATRWNDKN